MHTPQLCLAAALVCLALSACSPAVQPESQVRRMGERVQVGSLIYTVFEDQWKTQLGEGSDARVPKERFFLIRCTVANGGTGDLLVPAMILVDDGGQTYDELSNGDQVPQWTGYLRRVKPAQTLQGNIVFDVPPKHYRIRVADENSQGTREIDIPLHFQSDNPEMPAQQ